MANSHQKENTSKILKGGNVVQKNTVDSLLNRAIKFRKSRYVDEKLESFKRQYAPVNATNDSNKRPITASTGDTEELSGMDANGFLLPSKTLFAKNKLNPAWTTIRPVGSGLQNLGKGSALNAVLQTLSYTPALANYILEQRHGSNCAVSGYCFVCALEDHVRRCLMAKEDVVAPREFVGKLKKMTNGSTNDAYDVWRYFLDQIQHFLLMEKGSSDRRIQETTALYQIFGGYLQKNMACDACKKSNSDYSAFLHLSLDITRSNHIDKSLMQITRKETANIPCQSCEKSISNSIQQKIYKLPMVLVIHLERFSEDGAKNGKSVKFEETLNIEKHVAEGENRNLRSIYHLYAIIVHQGASRHSGNYVAYVKSANGIWYCMDNESVQQVSLKRVMNQQAHMLFYTQPPLPRKPEPVPTKAPEDIDVLKTMIELETTTASVEEVVETDEEEISLSQEVDEEGSKLEAAMQAAAAKPKVDNEQAIVVQHNETMESKRSKLDRLIEHETTHGRSIQAKEALLAKSGNGQFFEEVGRWDEDVGDAIEDKRKEVLKQVKSKRKKVDSYDLDYDRGKVKKVKKKQMDKFGKPNMFQVAADVQNMK
ncbi:Ubiquitin carboxyl-terminal hydrolase 36 [Apophysomyces ossiformis]|uniref:ubiquitinyl hydrolase 1 n=1 Tax=Apophysomyces ossiformis TaxID=679940 RepID=A0A8H7ELQ4_9FUNG|nr:Ubiquitin carboxyl-terminal hydrolase 36 [Apophysomyces ossiformis]